MKVTDEDVIYFMETEVKPAQLVLATFAAINQEVLMVMD